MKYLPVVSLALLLLGAATLFAEPEEEPDTTLGFTGDLEAGPAQAEALVKALAVRPPWKVRIDATFLRIGAERADELLGEHRPDAEGSARSIPADLGRQLVGGARGQGAVRPEPLPPLFLYDALTGRLSATGRHTYLQDYEWEGGNNAGTMPQPIVGRMEDGARVDVTLHQEREGLRVDLEAAWAEVVRPIPIFEASHPMVTIELPQLRMFFVQKQVELPGAGGYVLAGDGRARDGETLRLVVLEVRRAGR